MGVLHVIVMQFSMWCVLFPLSWWWGYTSHDAWHLANPSTHFDITIPGWFCHQPVGCCRRITHWGRVTHICVRKLTTIGSDNGLSLDRRQAIIWTNAGIVYWTHRNKLQWNCIQNSDISLQESVVCKIAAFLFRPQCDNWWKIFMLRNHTCSDRHAPTPTKGRASLYGFITSNLN